MFRLASYVTRKPISRIARSTRYTELLLSQRRRHSGTACSDPEKLHSPAPKEDKFDHFLSSVAPSLVKLAGASIVDLYSQYQHEAGSVIGRVVPYKERPLLTKRADASQLHDGDGEGDGLVLVVHAALSSSRQVVKTAVCSGFVVNASTNDQNQGDLIVTCAHTLEEINRYQQRAAKDEQNKSMSFIISASGQPRPITRLLSSMPRSDVIVLETATPSSSQRLRTLPLSPYPVHTGTPVLTHLFGSPDPPIIQRSISRTKQSHPTPNAKIESPIPWLNNHAYRRWGAGLMLGYRSYTGLELEAGISSVLPHILTSILPTPGSSGGPLVHAETGAVIGMTSGRRMDNRVEGERGWGCSAEMIFEMFSLPGFMPANQTCHPYP